MKTLVKSLMLFALTVQITQQAKAGVLSDDNGKIPAKRIAKTMSEGGSQSFDASTHIINLGVGFGGGDYYSAYRGGGYGYRSSPAFSISYEQALSKKVGPGYIGVGAYFGFQTASSTYNYYYNKNNNYNNQYYYSKNSWSNFLVGARAAYHWDVLNFEKVDIYGGLMLGARIQTYSYETNNPDPFYADFYRLNQGSTYLSFSVFAGARWYFANKVALFGEFGYGISYATVGLSFKF